MLLRHPRGRQGFTLVELMVAAALTILIMTVISVAFQAGLSTLSHLKSLGDLAERLRVAQDRLRDDLDCEHFYRGNTVGQRMLSDVHYDKDFDGREVPTKGYFRIEQGGPSLIEGIDSANMISTSRANPLDAIEFTIWRKTSQPDKMMSAALPGTEIVFVQQQTATDKSLGADQYVAEWARVRWQLKAQSSINGVQLYSLHRCVRLLANGNRPDNSPYICNYAQNPNDPNDPRKVLSIDGANQIQRADMATAAEPRPLIPVYDAVSGKQGDDLVLTNVVSFEVKPSWSVNPNPATPAPHNQAPRTMLSATVPNSDYPFDDLPVGARGVREFDTYTRTIPGAPPTNDIVFKARITGLQIKIRVYEPKNNMTRQSTIVVKL